LGSSAPGPTTVPLRQANEKQADPQHTGLHNGRIEGVARKGAKIRDTTRLIIIDGIGSSEFHIEQAGPLPCGRSIEHLLVE